jgi:hypothetical protein
MAENCARSDVFAHMERPRSAHATVEGAFHNGNDEAREEWSRDHALRRTFSLLEFEPFSRYFRQQMMNRGMFGK